MMTWALDQLYPPRCPACHHASSSEGNLCQPCFSKLHTIAEPHCVTCGIPFGLPVAEGTLCAQCLATPPVFDSARSVWVYDAVASRMIRRLKFEDHPEQLARFGSQLARIAAPVLTPDSIIMPVPMHWASLLSRRYNAAAWLAQALASRTGHACHTRQLLRAKSSRHQRGLGRAARLRNIRRAFRVSDAARSALAGAHVVLVDDVITTGATANACAKVLKAAGVARVDVVTLAHTVKEGSV